MNKVFESETMVVHDDRECLSSDEAFKLLSEGKAIRICYPPDFSAEYEGDIYDDDCPLYMTDIFPEGRNKLTDEDCRQIVYDYLRCYELYK